MVVKYLALLITLATRFFGYACSEYLFPAPLANVQQPSPYTSVAALDKYGNSVQLRNAMTASSLHGSLVIAALATTSRSVVVCSLHRPRPGVVDVTKNSDRKYLVQVVASDDDVGEEYGAQNSGTKSTTALVFTGVKADATLLLAIIREHARRMWERYDSVPTVDRVANALSEVLLSFMRYDRDREVHDGTGPVILDDDFDMARPFGLQSFVIGVGDECGPSLRSVDPSGVQDCWVARAMGRGSDKANKMLERRWRPGLTAEEARNMCSNIMCDIHREVRDGSGTRDTEASIIFETLSPSGLEIDVRRFAEVGGD